MILVTAIRVTCRSQEKASMDRSLAAWFPDPEWPEGEMLRGVTLGTRMGRNSRKQMIQCCRFSRRRKSQVNGNSRLSLYTRILVERWVRICNPFDILKVNPERYKPIGRSVTRTRPGSDERRRSKKGRLDPLARIDPPNAEEDESGDAGG